MKKNKKIPAICQGGRNFSLGKFIGMLSGETALQA